VIAQLAEAIDVFDVATDVPVGMGIPAEILPQTGHVICAPNLGWKDVPFRILAKQTLGRPIRLINDLNAITLGESRVGAAKGVGHLLCIYVGTGVGMGIISDGRLILGSHGFAGELGHFKVASVGEGNLCGCGDRGCLESYVSGRHLPMPAHDIEAAFLARDESAIELWGQCSRYLATAIINAVTLMNPKMVVLGGGVLEAAPSLRQQIKATIKALSNRAAIQNIEFRDAQYGDSAGVIGAGLYALGNASGG
jgi:glucokinase